MRLVSRRAFAVVMIVVLSFAATAVCLAGTTALAGKMACASMDDTGHMAALVNDCCAVDPPNSYASLVGSLTAAVSTPLLVVTQLDGLEPRVQAQFSPGQSRDRGPRHDSAARAHLFDAVFRI